MNTSAVEATTAASPLSSATVLDLLEAFVLGAIKSISAVQTSELKPMATATDIKCRQAAVEAKAHKLFCGSLTSTKCDKASSSSTEPLAAVLPPSLVAQEAYNLLLQNTHTTQRDLYYAHASIFAQQGGQKALEKTIGHLTTILSASPPPSLAPTVPTTTITREDLNIGGGVKSSFVGNVTFALTPSGRVQKSEACPAVHSGGAKTIDVSVYGTAGLPISHHMATAHHFQTNAEAIIVVEKEASLMQLVNDGAHRRFLLLCGRGYPCVAARLFLKAISSCAQHLPILFYVDADPHGVAIMVEYIKALLPPEVLNDINKRVARDQRSCRRARDAQKNKDATRGEADTRTNPQKRKRGQQEPQPSTVIMLPHANNQLSPPNPIFQLNVDWLGLRPKWLQQTLGATVPQSDLRSITPTDAVHLNRVLTFFTCLLPHLAESSSAALTSCPHNSLTRSTVMAWIDELHDMKAKKQKAELQALSSVVAMTHNNEHPKPVTFDMLVDTFLLPS